MTKSNRILALNRLAGLLAVALATPAWAFHPFITDDTGTQGSGGNQIELGYNSSVSKEAGVTGKSRDIPLTYTRGLTEDLDVFAGVAYQTKPVHGWGNVAVGAKWRFYDSEPLSLGIKPEIRLPVSKSDENDGLGQGETSYAITFLATRETGFGAVHFNAAAEYNGYANPTTDRKRLYRVSIAPVWDVTDGWKLGMDLGLQTNPDSTKKSRMGYVSIGAIYSPSDDLDFSLGLTRDVMDGAAKTTSATFELTWRFR